VSADRSGGATAGGQTPVVAGADASVLREAAGVRLTPMWIDPGGAMVLTGLSTRLSWPVGDTSEKGASSRVAAVHLVHGFFVEAGAKHRFTAYERLGVLVLFERRQ